MDFLFGRSLSPERFEELNIPVPFGYEAAALVERFRCETIQAASFVFSDKH